MAKLPELERYLQVGLVAEKQHLADCASKRVVIAARTPRISPSQIKRLVWDSETVAEKEEHKQLCCLHLLFCLYAK